MPLRLNAGSGQRLFDTSKGWTNIDINPKWNPDVVADWTDLSMFEDGSADIIVAHHTIEHVGCGEARPFFKEAHRILQLGGSLIITLPSLRALAQRWLAHQIDDYTFMVSTYGAYMGDEEDRHLWGYTLDSLTDELRESTNDEWHAIKLFDWREIVGADIARDWWIWGMEAIK